MVWGEVCGVALHGGWGRPAPAPAHAATTLVGGLVAPPREPTTAAEAFWKMPHKGTYTSLRIVSKLPLIPIDTKLIIPTMRE